MDNELTKEVESHPQLPPHFDRNCMHGLIFARLLPRLQSLIHSSEMKIDVLYIILLSYILPSSCLPPHIFHLISSALLKTPHIFHLPTSSSSSSYLPPSYILHFHYILLPSSSVTSRLPSQICAFFGFEPSVRQY